jgi:hypothetical protein
MAAHEFDSVSRLAFLAAMQKAFQWDLPVPENAINELLQSDAFDVIFTQTRPTGTPALSPKDYDAAHFEALANDPRVQFFINDYLAKDTSKYLRKFVQFLWKEVREGFRNWLKRWVNPREHAAAEHPSPTPSRIPMGHPVFNTAALAVVLYAGYYVIRHPPEIRITMAAPAEFPAIKIDAPVKFDTAKVRFADVRFEEPPELKVAKFQFGPAPALSFAKLQFDTPPHIEFGTPPNFHLVPNSTIRLDTTAATLDIVQSKTFTFEPLKFKDASIPLTFDNPPGFRLDVSHHFDDLLQAQPLLRFSDKRQGFLWSSHIYSLEVNSKNPPPPTNTPTDQLNAGQRQSNASSTPK